MTGSRSTAPRRRRLAVRGAFAALAAALALVATPGTASAAGTVTPLLDCYVQNSDGSFTALLGYSNTTGRTQTIARGTNNVLTPSRYDGVQPTSFKSGTFHGVFTVKLAAADVPYANWTLNGANLSTAVSTTTSCPPGTTLPATGNGTGIAIALVAAAAAGVLVVRRAVRRAGSTTPAPVTQES